MIYELKETGRATALFAGWQDSVVWSALQGVMGKSMWILWKNRRVVLLCLGISTS